MAENQAPGFEKEAELGEKGSKFQNRGYWGYHEGEEGGGGMGGERRRGRRTGAEEAGYGYGTGIGCGGG
jgi:hypothetical protein